MALEHAIRDGVFPPRLAGPLGVCLASFFSIVLFFSALAKLRPDSERALAKAKADQAAARKEGRHEPSIRSVKSELPMRILAWLHAAVVGQGAFRLVLMNPYFTSNGLLRLPEQLSLEWTDPVAEFYFSIGAAFFLGDLIVLMISYEEYGPLFLFHACCGLFGLGWAVLTHQGHAYCLVAFCFELSTPFVNHIFFLKTYGGTGPVWKLLNLINGLVCTSPEPAPSSF